LKKNEPIKALTMMDLAHSLNPSSEQGKTIDADMHIIFKNLLNPLIGFFFLVSIIFTM